MKYGSYGHINLQLPWGMPKCSLKDADSCPIFNHSMPYTYGVDNGVKPLNSHWWPKITGIEEEITMGEDYERVWDWLKTHNKL